MSLCYPEHSADEGRISTWWTEYLPFPKYHTNFLSTSQNFRYLIYGRYWIRNKCDKFIVIKNKNSKCAKNEITKDYPVLIGHFRYKYVIKVILWFKTIIID